jgi:hypothetical protein
MTDHEEDEEDGPGHRGDSDRPARVRAPAPDDGKPTSINRLGAHFAGQVIGLPDVLRQLSTRVGSLPLRATKRVYFPI